MGRFAGMDVIGGFVDVPVTLNRYGYCWNNPEKYVDRDGNFPITVAMGVGIGAIVGKAGSAVSQVYSGGESFSYGVYRLAGDKKVVRREKPEDIGLNI